MASAFDPYHKWLGIPPAEQPAGHYRLLGLSPFEADPEVIDAAANRQMAYVQGFAAGEHRAAAREILNELAAARLCLLDPPRRAAYDAGSRETQAPAPAPPPGRPEPTPARTPGGRDAARPVGKAPRGGRAGSTDRAGVPTAAAPVPAGRPERHLTPAESSADPAAVIARPLPGASPVGSADRPGRDRVRLAAGAAALALLFVAAGITVRGYPGRRVDSVRAQMTRPARPPEGGSAPAAPTVPEGTGSATRPVPARGAAEGGPPALYAADAVEFQGSHFKVYWEETSWPEAEELCRRRGGRLACIGSDEGQDFLAGFKGDGKVVWLGGYRDRLSRWRWLDGEEIPRDRVRGDESGLNYVAFDTGDTLNCRTRSGHAPGYAVERVQGFLCEWGPSPSRVPDGGRGDEPFGEPVGEVCRFSGHTGGVCGVTFSPDGRLAASGGDDKTVRLWEIATGRQLWASDDFHGKVTAVAFSPDGRTILACSPLTLKRLDAATGSTLEVTTIPVVFEGPQWVSFSADRKRVASNWTRSGVLVSDTARGDAILTLKIGPPSVTLTPDGRGLLCGTWGGDAPLELRDVASGAISREYRGCRDWTMAMAVSPDGRLVAAGTGPPSDKKAGAENIVRVWDLHDGRLHWTSQRLGGWQYTVAFSPDSRFLMSGGGGRGDDWGGFSRGCDNSLGVWNVATGKEVHRFEGHRAAVQHVEFSPDGRHAISGSTDSTVRLWRLPDEAPR